MREALSLPLPVGLRLVLLPRCEKMVLFIVFCQVKAYGSHLYIIICWRTGCPAVGVLVHTLGIAVIGIVGQ